MTQHLTLEELIDGSRNHPGCQHCQAEASAWAAVRAGVRHQADITRPPVRTLESVLTEIGEQPAARHRWRRMTPLSAAAAAVLVLAAGGYGVARALHHAGSTAGTGTGSSAELTATGCSGLELAGGTLTRTAANDLVITTTDGGQVTVTTTNTTAIYRETTGTLSDITDGEHVLVTGSLDGGTLTATSVSELPATVTQPASPGSGLGIGLASGTVANDHDGEFTVVEPDGSRVTVVTSASVIVIAAKRITVAQLKTGEITSAVGTAVTDGILTATTVEQDAVPASTWQKLRPQAPSGLPGALPSISAPKISLNGLGCSPAAITSSYLLADHLQQ